MTCGCIHIHVQTEPLEPLLRWVAPSAPEAPREMALDYLRQALIEFARKTGLMRYEATLPIQRGVRNYELIAPEGYEVFALKDVNYQEFPYQRFPDAHSWWYMWGYKFRMEGNRELVFRDEPSADDNTRKIVFHLIPTDCADTIPTEIATPFGKGIAMGALADLLEIPSKPWSNPQLAQKKRLDYNRTVLSGRQLEITNRGAKTPMFRPVRVL